MEPSVLLDTRGGRAGAKSHLDCVHGNSTETKSEPTLLGFVVQETDVVPWPALPHIAILFGLSQRWIPTCIAECEDMVPGDKQAVLFFNGYRPDEMRCVADCFAQLPAYAYFLPDVRQGCQRCLRSGKPCVVYGFHFPTFYGTHWRMMLRACLRCAVAGESCRNEGIELVYWPSETSSIPLQYSFTYFGQKYDVPWLHYHGPDHGRPRGGDNSLMQPPSQIVPISDDTVPSSQPSRQQRDFLRETSMPLSACDSEDTIICVDRLGVTELRWWRVVDGSPPRLRSPTPLLKGSQENGFQSDRIFPELNFTRVPTESVDDQGEMEQDEDEAAARSAERMKRSLDSRKALDHMSDHANFPPIPCDDSPRSKSRIAPTQSTFSGYNWPIRSPPPFASAVKGIVDFGTSIAQVTDAISRFTGAFKEYGNWKEQAKWERDKSQEAMCKGQLQLLNRHQSQLRGHLLPRWYKQMSNLDRTLDDQIGPSISGSARNFGLKKRDRDEVDELDDHPSMRQTKWKRARRSKDGAGEDLQGNIETGEKERETSGPTEDPKTGSQEPIEDCAPVPVWGW